MSATNSSGWAIMPCRRCEATGEAYGFDKRCHECGGSGVAFTPAAKAARKTMREQLEAIRRTDIAEVRAGDVLVVSHHGRQFRVKVREVTREAKSAEQLAAGEDFGGSATVRDGVPIRRVFTVRYEVEFEPQVVAHGLREFSRLCLHDGDIVSRVNDAEAEAAIVAAAKSAALGKEVAK